MLGGAGGHTTTRTTTTTTTRAEEEPDLPLHRGRQGHALRAALQATRALGGGLGTEDPGLPRPQDHWLFVHGPRNSGKSRTLHALLQAPGGRTDLVAVVDCQECYTLPLVLEEALEQFASQAAAASASRNGEGAREEDEVGAPSLVACPNLDRFLKALARLAKHYGPGLGPRHHLLVLDHAEELLGYPGFLEALCHTQSHLQAAVAPAGMTVVLVSRLGWHAYAAALPASTPPQQVAFPPYTVAELRDLLLLPEHLPPGVARASQSHPNGNGDGGGNSVPVEHYAAFCKLVLDMLQVMELDVRTLCSCLWRMWTMYWRPVLQGKVGPTEVSKLSHLLRPELVRLMRTGLHGITDGASGACVDVEKFDLQLPYYTKFLLIASFLASFNPPRLDTRYFSRTGVDKRAPKRAALAKQGGRLRQQLLGPRPFPVDRMLAIFYSLLESDVPGSVDIQQQVSALLSLGLVVLASPEGRLDGIKLKCVLGYDDLQAVSATVGLEVDKYLYDFC